MTNKQILIFQNIFNTEFDELSFIIDTFKFRKFGKKNINQIEPVEFDGFDWIWWYSSGTTPSDPSEKPFKSRIEIFDRTDEAHEPCFEVIIHCDSNPLLLFALTNLSRDLYNYLERTASKVKTTKHSLSNQSPLFTSEIDYRVQLSQPLPDFLEESRTQNKSPQEEDINNHHRNQSKYSLKPRRSTLSKIIKMYYFRVDKFPHHGNITSAYGFAETTDKTMGKYFEIIYPGFISRWDDKNFKGDKFPKKMIEIFPDSKDIWENWDMDS